MLAKLIALLIVAAVVFGPATFLLRTAWFQGGLARRVAILFLCVAFLLISWLMAPTDPGQTREENISQFLGAWGILVGCGGVLAIVATLLGWFRVPASKDDE